MEGKLLSFKCLEQKYQSMEPRTRANEGKLAALHVDVWECLLRGAVGRAWKTKLQNKQVELVLLEKFTLRQDGDPLSP